jgi:2,4-dienoyl-CoA reductase-like NADH-dependent reductase (Old Yellow Enzyme family)
MPFSSEAAYTDISKSSTSTNLLSGQILGQQVNITGSCILKNRIAKSAMSEALAGADGAPNALHEALYSQWAAGGAGLCITGNVMIDRNAVGEPGNVVIEDDRHLAALKCWAAAGTRNGSQLWMQINHPGKQAPKGLNPETVAPSAIPFKAELQTFFGTPRELADSEIVGIIARYGRAAGIAKRAGFTGVQIHGAHGYLVSQFLSPYHNHRTDRWGGSAEARRRFVLEVLTAMRAEVGAVFPIGIKLNSADFQHGGFTEEESLETLRALAKAGIDMIEISGGTYEAPAMTGVKVTEQPKESTRKREAYFLEFAEKARQVVDTPLMVTGGFRTPEGMAQYIACGAVDIVGIARSMALEPDLPSRLMNGMQPLYQVRPIKTGFAAIDRSGLLEITWYTRQLRRIAHGKAPDPGESGLKVFAINLYHNLITMFRGKKRTRMLRAGH